MLKQIMLATLGYFLCMPFCAAQKKGMLPLTGMHYFNEGIWPKSIAVKISGDLVFGNRIPLNREIEMSFVQPAGFTADKKKKYFIGAEYSLISAKGELLRNIPNLLFEQETLGFTAKDLNQITVKFGIAEGIIEPNSKAVIKIRLYDLKGTKQLTLNYPISISYPKETIYLTKMVQTLKSPVGSVFMSTGLKAGSVVFSVDSLVASDKKMDYLNLVISKIDGTDIIGMLEGKEKFWVYDSAFNEIKIKEVLLKKVGGALEGGTVNSTLKIPFRLKKDKPKVYYIRYRWEGQDKRQVLDIIVAK